MTIEPKTAMVLAAGLGTRMRPLTEQTAKPLLPLGGRTLLDHALDRLADCGVETVAVNGYWHGDRVRQRLDARGGAPRTVFRQETTLLETGGGVRNALDILGSGPFFVINGDAFWLDGPTPALRRLVRTFDDSVDAVLLVHRTFQISADVGRGDFMLDKWGVPRRRQEREIAPYLYAGVQLIRASILDGMPDGAFSMNLAWERAMAAGRVRAVVHDGMWFHLSTPEDLSAAEARLEAPVAAAAAWPWR